MLKEESDAVIVESIIGLAHNLGLRVVAEGVETDESWERLADLRCDSAQGLFISPGLPITALVSWARTADGRGDRDPGSERAAYARELT